MTDHETDDYAEWLKKRRSVLSNDNLTDRIMSAVNELTPNGREPSMEAQSTPVVDDPARSCSLTAEASRSATVVSARPQRPNDAFSLAEPAVRSRDRIGPVLLLTAASLFFAARIASLVGNLAFPTESFPEFANDQKIEEPADEHGNAARS